MENDSKIPDSWAVPHDLAKKVSETLNKKKITPEDELADALGDMARDIALIEPDPQDWGGWVIFLLEKMEGEAKRRGNGRDYLEMLRSLKQDLGNRNNLG